MTLVRAIGFHWHAVQREVLGLGRRAADMFTPRLTASEVIAVVMAPHMSSALRYEMTHGVSLADYLRRPLPEPVDTRPPKPPDINNPDEPVQHIAGDTMTIEQFEARMRAHQGG